MNRIAPYPDMARCIECIMTSKFQVAGWIVLISAGLIFAYAMFSKVDRERMPDSSRQNNQATSGQPDGALSRMGNSWGASPFSGTTNSESLAAEVAAARHEKMKRLGYETPAKYYEMTLAQLEELAKNGDVHAMIQLAEQYHSEQDYIRNTPGFDRSRNPRDIAMENLEKAIRAGYTQAASVAAIQKVEDNNLVDAYAWHLLAQRLNEHTNDKLYETDATFAKMSPMDKAEARGRLDVLRQRLIAETN